MKKDLSAEVPTPVRAEDKRHVLAALALFLLVASVFAAVTTISAVKSYRFIGEDPARQNTIVVSGKGEVVAVPDTATFTFTVSTESLSVKDAQESVAKKEKTALAFLSTNGVEKRDIKTVNYSVYPEYEYRQDVCRGGLCPPGGERALKGYEVSQTVLVKVRDIDAAGGVLGGMGAVGVSEISELSLTVDTEEDLARQARKQAIQKARKEAETLAGDLGVRLIRIVSFSEDGSRYPIPQFEKLQAASADSAPGSPVLPAGENTITSQVNIIYEIR